MPTLPVRLLSLIACALVLASPNSASAAEKRIGHLGAFDAIQVSGGFQVHLTSHRRADVRLSGDSDALKQVEVSVSGHTLVIRDKQQHHWPWNWGNRKHESVTVSVSLPSLTSLELAGAVTLDGQGLNEKDLRLSGSGASDVALAGRAHSLVAELSGAGHLRAGALKLDTARLSLSGACDAEMDARKQLDIEGSGACHVRYHGNPKVSQKLSGVCSVESVR